MSQPADKIRVYLDEYREIEFSPRHPRKRFVVGKAQRIKGLRRES
jgi:hypothetical protein